MDRIALRIEKDGSITAIDQTTGAEVVTDQDDWETVSAWADYRNAIDRRERGAYIFAPPRDFLEEGR